MDRSFRIRTDIGSDKCVNVNLQQDIDVYEILSLKLRQESLYKLHSSDYGVVVGRVLANDAFGIENAKVSVFIPLNAEDTLRSSLESMYPYKTVNDFNRDNVRFNTLPNYKVSECHVPVGSFPKKRLVLDDDSVLEVFDKYYKYTTVTNKSGDYMVFGVPTGNQVLHVDIDLSDIGVLSQHPRDLVYKGYSMDMFQSPVQFKKSTNLDDLAQIHSESTSITVYPFWGDRDSDEIAITRKDINIQYQFNPTCVFMGSVMTDNGGNSISHNCIPDANVGDAGQLVPSEGTIEMIRKTPYDSIEEFSINGNQLIDSNGVFCYQIPMNLDYVGMDEYGNIVPTDNPLKGIPTRSRVRFRFTLNETSDDTLTRHAARYLVPNNMPLLKTSELPMVDRKTFNDDSFYQFGTYTPDECFRDLYWNKVYSVKGYVPRLQTSKYEKTANYLAIKGVNKKDARKNNLIPYNKLNLNFSIPSYAILSHLGTDEDKKKPLGKIKGYWNYLKSNSIPYSVDTVREEVLEDMDALSLDFYNDWLNGCLYFPLWFWHIRKKRKHKKGQSVYESMYCDCKNSDAKLKLVNNFSLHYENTELRPKGHEDWEKYYEAFRDRWNTIQTGSKAFYGGIIKHMENKDGVDLFYYSAGNRQKVQEVASGTSYNYVRLFSTDIILLGSLNDCDIDGVPQVSTSLPSTTSNIPPMGRPKHPDYEKNNEEEDDGRDSNSMTQYVLENYGEEAAQIINGTSEEDEEVDESEPKADLSDGDYLISYNGMNWGEYWTSKNVKKRRTNDNYKYVLGSGLFFGLQPIKIYHGSDWQLIPATALFGPLGSLLGKFLNIFGKRHKRTDIVPICDFKSGINAERICELGVTLDSTVSTSFEGDDNRVVKVNMDMDGLITKHELEDLDTRALFATLNHNKLVGKIANSTTGYKAYELTYMYPTNFDGRLEYVAPIYTNEITHDERNKDYLDFRLGVTSPRVVTSESTVHDRMQNHSFTKYTNLTEYAMYLLDIGDGTSQREGGSGGARRRSTITSSEGSINTRPHFYTTPAIADDGGIYAFPLYENSFYFFFGLNKGSTAVDRFHELFFSKCVDDSADPFGLKINWEYSKCGEKNGSIELTFNNIATPYRVTLTNDDGESVEFTAYKSEADAQAQISGMPCPSGTFEDGRTDYCKLSGIGNGEYVVSIYDATDNVITDTVKIVAPKVKLNATLVNNITTEYKGNYDVIRDQGYYALIRLNSITLYDETVILPNRSSIPNGVPFSIANGVSMIAYYEDGTVSGSDDSMTPGIKLRVCKPQTIKFLVYEDACPDENYSMAEIEVTDEKQLEMEINNVPLKMLVGANESDPNSYNENFRPRSGVYDDINDVRGWFGVHDPKTYDPNSDNVFNFDITRQDESGLTYDDMWGSPTPSVYIERRLRYMTDISKAAYVTASSNPTFNVKLSGGNGENLLRSVMPSYDDMPDDNNIDAGGIDTYKTSENSTANGNNISPNIVSYNYRYNNDKGMATTEDSILGGKDYDFNPKYANSTMQSGNFFAGFSNNANIVVLDETGICGRNMELPDFQRIPAKAIDIKEADRNNTACVTYSKDEFRSEANTEHPYIRTEFIDRRFDYDMLYITPHRVLDGEIDEDTWSKGRMSGVTFNGIEMRYMDDAKRTILSENPSATEYSYNKATAQIAFDPDGLRRFYESTLKYGDGRIIDLRKGYHSNVNDTPSAVINNTYDRAPEAIMNGHDRIGDTVCDNFGLVGDTIKGYPTVRYLDFKNVPYGDNYEFKNVSCGYGNITISTGDDSIAAYACPGETVSYSIEAGDLVHPVVKDFKSDYSQGKYNVEYRYSGGNCVSTNFKLDFNIISNGSNGYLTKVENDLSKNKLGVRLLKDDDRLNKLKTIKESKSVSELTTNVASNSSDSLSVPNTYDTSDEFKRNVFRFDVDLANTDKNVAILFDRYYYSNMGDSLLKRIRALNASTIYNVDDFGLTLNSITEWKYDMNTTVDKDTVNVDVEVDVNGSVSTEGGDTGSFDGSGSGSGKPEENPTGTTSEKHDVSTFTITSEYIVKNLENIAFKIKLGSDTEFYEISDMNVTSQDTTMELVFPWLKHRQLLKDAGTATVDAYIKLKNGLVYHIPLPISSGGTLSGRN